jgi:signal transduction histidine kinase
VDLDRPLNMPTPPNERRGSDDASSDARRLLDSIARGLELAPERSEGSSENSASSGSAGQERSFERLLEIAYAMNRIHDRDLLFENVSRWLRELFDAENSFVILLDKTGRPDLRTAFMREPGSEAFPISETILKRAIEAGCPISIEDATEVPDLSDRVSVERLKIRSVLCAPLMVGERVIGVLQFDHRSSSASFPEQDRRLLQLFADQAATAFHNLELIEQLSSAAGDLRSSHARLVQAERLAALGEMATGMAHNFNNTLFIALGYCDVLHKREDLGSDVLEAITNIRECALDAASTVRRLQEFARGGDEAEATQLLCYPSKVLEKLVPGIGGKLLEAEKAKQIQIRIRTELVNTAPVAARAADLREILINLIFNSVDAMSSSGEIVLSSGTEGERAFLSVKDDGCGMSPEVSERVFEPFFTTKHERGVGLGLSTSWSIARRLGGELEVTSQVGQGSQFTLWLQVAKEEPGVGVSSLLEEDGESLRVLVIDDDPRVLKTMGQLLRTLGHETVECREAAKGLEAFPAGRFDVVVTDLGMPGTSGADVAREVHRMDPEVPVLVMTGWGTEAVARARAGEGVSGVLSKPLSLETIRDALSRGLGC